MSRHIYVVDTCVLLHDPLAIHKFAENDIYLPLAVIDDLDEIKTRPANVGWSAREVFRILDTFNVQDMMSKGVVVNDKGGKLYVYNTEAPLAKGEIPNISRVNSDNAIINCCIALKSKYPRRKVSIVTKDTGLRIRALSWGCEAENYRADLLDDQTYSGIRHATISSNDDWQHLWNNTEVSPAHLSSDLQKQIENLSPHEFVIFDWDTKSIPTIYRNGVLYVLKDKSSGENPGKMSYMGITAKNLEQRCALEILGDNNIPLVAICGKAGTGKTILTLGVSLDMVLHQGRYDRIIVIKPLIPVGGKDIGALPGDKFEKIGAWLGPMRDNIQQLIITQGGSSKTANADFEELVRSGIIEVEAMTFIQGRSIPNSIVIVDEAQNLTPRETRMVVERCGKNSKIILLGDMSQIENSYLDARSCGLSHALNGSKDQELCAAVTLTKVERSQLAAVASKIFNSPEAQR